MSTTEQKQAWADKFELAPQAQHPGSFWSKAGTLPPEWVTSIHDFLQHNQIPVSVVADAHQQPRLLASMKAWEKAITLLADWAPPPAAILPQDRVREIAPLQVHSSGGFGSMGSALAGAAAAFADSARGPMTLPPTSSADGFQTIQRDGRLMTRTKPKPGAQAECSFYTAQMRKALGPDADIHCLESITTPGTFYIAAGPDASPHMKSALPALQAEWHRATIAAGQLQDDLKTTVTGTPSEAFRAAIENLIVDVQLSNKTECVSFTAPDGRIFSTPGIVTGGLNHATMLLLDRAAQEGRVAERVPTNLRVLIETGALDIFYEGPNTLTPTMESKLGKNTPAPRV